MLKIRARQRLITRQNPCKGIETRSSYGIVRHPYYMEIFQMKCSNCHSNNAAHNKFCKECGQPIINESSHKNSAVKENSELYGKEVEIVFYIDPTSGKITGLVNPTDELAGKIKKNGVRQRVTIEPPDNVVMDTDAGTVLAFIRQSKDFLGENYDEADYRNIPVAELKKEYLKLFERVLKTKAQRGIK